MYHRELTSSSRTAWPATKGAVQCKNPNLQVSTFLDSGQDAPSSTLRCFDPWAHWRHPEGLPDERLAVRRSSPLSRVQGGLASSTTPTARPTRYHSTRVQTIWVRSSSNTGPYGPTPGILSTSRVDWTLCVQRRRTRCPHRPSPAGDDLPDWPWTNHVLRLRQGNSTSCPPSFDQ